MTKLIYLILSSNYLTFTGSPIFTVAKIKIYRNKKTPVYDGGRVPFSFELESPIIEIYKDKALTNKIGEINVDKLVFK